MIVGLLPRSMPWIVGASAAVVGVGATIVALRASRPRRLNAVLPASAPIVADPADAGVASADAPSAEPPGETSTDYERPTWSPDVPAAVYDALSGDACEAELRRRGISYADVDQAPGVERPVRLTGPLHGVGFHGVGLASGSTSPYEIADCRLVLALDDLAKRLSEHGIVEVLHFSMYRPAALASTVHSGRSRPPRPPSAPRKAAHPNKPAPRSSSEGGPRRALGHKPPPKISGGHSGDHTPNEHLHGLAIDIAAFVRSDGTRVDVKTAWLGRIGDPPCGPGSAPHEPERTAGRDPESVRAEAFELRGIVCEVERARLFNVILTPNANAAHEDHFHLDITEDARWFLIE